MTQAQLSGGAVGVLEVLGYLATAASLVMSILSIVLSIRYKKEADQVNKDTSKLLMDVRADERAIVEGILPELRASGQAVRELAMNNNRVDGAKLGSTSTGVVSYAADALLISTATSESQSSPDQSGG